MSYDYSGIYAALGPSGLAPFVVPVGTIPTFKLVLGADSYDPYRGAGAGRAYTAAHFHIYTADQEAVCSGEALGRSPPPAKALMGEYRVSGQFVDIDKIEVPGFQDAWRACSGEGRHEFSQQFTDYLHTNGYFPAGAVGFTWTSVSGQLLGIGGRCYATTVTGEPNVVFQKSYAYPQKAELREFCVAAADTGLRLNKPVTSASGGRVRRLCALYLSGRYRRIACEGGT